MSPITVSQSLHTDPRYHYHKPNLTPREHSVLVSNRLLQSQETLIVQEKRKIWGELLPGVGTFLLAVTSPLMLFSPYLAKKIIPDISKYKLSWLKMPLIQTGLQRYSDKDTILKDMLR